VVLTRLDADAVSLHGGFLERIFGDVLGYRTMALAADGKWEFFAACHTFPEDPTFCCGWMGR